MKIEFDYPRREWVQLKEYLFPYKARSELVQDFFDKVFGKDAVKSATDGKEKLKADAMGHFETQANQKFINDMTEHLIANTKFSLPAAVLKKYRESLTREKTAFFEIAAMANNSFKSFKM